MASSKGRLAPSGIGEASRMKERMWSVMGQPDLDGVLSALPSHGESWIVLLNFFDFTSDGRVSAADWNRGLLALGMHGLAEDAQLWTGLLAMYHDPEQKDVISLARIKYKVPFDPIVTTLLRSVVHTSGNMRGLLDASNRELARWQEREEQRQARLARQNQLKIDRQILAMQLRALRPVMRAWLELRANQKLLDKRSAHFRRRFRALRSWNAWKRHADDEHARLRRHAVILRSRIGREWKRWRALHDAALAATEAAAAMRARLERRGNAVLMYRVRRAWAEWAEWRQLHRRLAKLGRRARLARVATAFGRLSSSRSKQRRLRRIAARALQRRERRALDAWREIAAARGARRARLRRFLQAAKPLGRGWNAWRHWVALRRRNLQMAKRALHPARQAG